MTIRRRADPSDISSLQFYNLFHSLKAVVALQVLTMKALNVNLHKPEVGGSTDETGQSYIYLVSLGKEHSYSCVARRSPIPRYTHFV